MNSPPAETSQRLSERLCPEISTFRLSAYSIADDLASLSRISDAGATEAIIFYCARILEALAAAAISTIGLSPSSSVFTNLESLAGFGLMPRGTQYWANALRRLGNDVRHMLRRAAPADAAIAALFVEQWIDWYFCQFIHGPRAARTTRDGQPILPHNNAHLTALLKEIDAPEFDPMKWVNSDRGAQPPYMAAGTIAAAVANRLIDRGEIEAAFAVLEPAQAKFPDDLRLQQLAVFGWKRRGNLQKAAQCAGTLLARSRDDDESAGIVAGVYKQMYLDQGLDREILGKSFRAYASGWDGSKSSNTYLGINAAALALWLGRARESRRLADEVRQALSKRMAAISTAGGARELTISFWDQVTLAEAELLCGEFAASRARYLSAFTRWADDKGNIKVAKEQAARHFTLLGIRAGADDFFIGSAEIPATMQLSLGISGHRQIEETSQMRQRVIDAVTALQSQVTSQNAGMKPGVMLYSSLAAGADCLLAEIVLDDFHGMLTTILPLEIADYRTDFSPREAERFDRLLSRSSTVIYPARRSSSRGNAPEQPSEQDQRTIAYEQAGRYIADHCQMLIALWDGQPSRGRGGTAEIVAYARENKVPVEWIKIERLPAPG